MNDVLLLSGFMSVPAACAIFALLYMTISVTLKQASFFKRKMSAIVALCVSLLGIIGLFRFFGTADKAIDVVDKSDSSGTVLDVILLPYAALAVAVLLLFLLLFLSKIFQSGKLKRHFNEIEDQLKKLELIKKQNEKRLIK